MNLLQSLLVNKGYQQLRAPESQAVETFAVLRIKEIILEKKYQKIVIF